MEKKWLGLEEAAKTLVGNGDRKYFVEFNGEAVRVRFDDGKIREEWPFEVLAESRNDYKTVEDAEESIYDWIHEYLYEQEMFQYDPCNVHPDEVFYPPCDEPETVEENDEKQAGLNDVAAMLTGNGEKKVWLEVRGKCDDGTVSGWAFAGELFNDAENEQEARDTINGILNDCVQEDEVPRLDSSGQMYKAQRLDFSGQMYEAYADAVRLAAGQLCDKSVTAGAKNLMEAKAIAHKASQRQNIREYVEAVTERFRTQLEWDIRNEIERMLMEDFVEGGV